MAQLLLQVKFLLHQSIFVTHQGLSVSVHLHHTHLLLLLLLLLTQSVRHSSQQLVLKCRRQQSHMASVNRFHTSTFNWDFTLHHHVPYSQQFLLRDAMRKRGLCCRPVSVRLSVHLSLCPSRSCIVSRRLKISSNIFPAR